MRPRTILIVEDEMDMRFFLVTLCRANGFNASAARNGKEGLAQARAVRPDLILLDVMMPEQGGLVLYAAIKNDPELQATPVVMLSAVSRTDFHHSLAMLNAGRQAPIPPPEAYLEKPPEPETILHAIQRWVPMQ
ncbi:MAG: response regulator [Desulfatitalea sp.]|nr:response regulator [Desulfatitalea sp.]NNJ98832.1 response regulator [Desulfatitalea sp.]